MTPQTFLCNMSIRMPYRLFIVYGIFYPEPYAEEYKSLNKPHCLHVFSQFCHFEFSAYFRLWRPEPAGSAKTTELYGRQPKTFPYSVAFLAVRLVPFYITC